MGGITLSGKNNDQGVVIKGSGSAPIQNANVSPQTMVAPNYQTTATTSNQYYGGNIASPQAPAPAPAPNNTPTPDPWASTVWGSKGAYDQAVGDYNATKNNTMGSINDAISTSGLQQKSSILDFIDSYSTGQKGINSASVQNEMAREQGRLGILDMIGTGVRSGGVTLNNMNAGNSSATEALAKAYSMLGRKEMTKVGNQHAMGKEKIKQSQEELAGKATTFRRHAEENKTLVINSILSTATQQLSALDAAAASASLPERINLEAEKTRIRNQAMAELSQYDSILNSGISSNAPKSDAQLRQEASQMLNMGTAPENSFNYTSSVPAQFAGTGPFASTLPIFTGY